MGSGLANVLGATAAGFEGARQQDLQRQFADEQNRRNLAADFLGKIAFDESAPPEMRNAALQGHIQLSQTPYGKRVDVGKLFEPIFQAHAQAQAAKAAAAQAPAPPLTQTFTPPPQPPSPPGAATSAPSGQMGPPSVPQAAAALPLQRPPAPPQAGQVQFTPPPGPTPPPTPPESLLGSPERSTEIAAQRAGGVAGGTLAGQIAARQAALAGMPVPPEQAAMMALGLPPTMYGTYGQGDVIPASQAKASGIALPQGVDEANGWVHVTRDRFNNITGVRPAAPPSAYAEQVSHGFTYQWDPALGATVAIPVDTTKQRIAPGAGTPAGTPPPTPPGAEVRPGQKVKVGGQKPPQALMIVPPTTPGGTPTAQRIAPGTPVSAQAVTPGGLSSANIPTSTIRTMAQRSQGQLASIQQLSDEIDRQDKAGNLGPTAGRWNAFMQNKVGAGDPDYSYLKDKLDLVQTAMMLIHVGGRGSTPILSKFQGMLDAGKMDAPTLKAGLRAIKEQMQNYASEGKIPGFGGTPESTNPPPTPPKKAFRWEDHPPIQ